MRGLTSEERRAERLQALTFLGLLADDVALATIHYPNLSDEERHALTELQDLLATVSGGHERASRAFPRRMSMNDPTAILREAASLGGVGTDAVTTPPDLETLRAPLEQLSTGSADEAALDAVRAFAELVSQVTLLLAEQLANEKSADGWIHQISTSYAA